MQKLGPMRVEEDRRRSGLDIGKREKAGLCLDCRRDWDQHGESGGAGGDAEDGGVGGG